VPKTFVARAARRLDSLARVASFVLAVAALLGVVACSADHVSEQANARVQQGVDQNPSLVIRQVYKGGEPPAAYAHDFVEIFNRGTAPASLSGVALQIWVSSSSYHWLGSPLFLAGAQEGGSPRGRECGV
jgi:hypothetical protein